MKKLLYVSLICSSFSYAAYEQLTGEQKQELLMNMFFDRHLTKKEESKNDPSLGTMLYERNKDVYWDFYCMFLRSEADAVVYRVREYAKFHALRQYRVAHTTTKATTPEYLLPSLSRPLYVDKARVALRKVLNIDCRKEDLLECVRGVELLYKVHTRLAIPVMERERFNDLCFTVMQKSIACEPLQPSERDAMDKAIQWVVEAEPLVLPNEIEDEMVSAYTTGAKAQLEACIHTDVSSKSCCVQ